MTDLPKARLYYLGDSFGYRATIIRGAPAYTATKKQPTAALQVLATMAGAYEVVCYQRHTDDRPTNIQPVRIDVDCTDRQSTMVIAGAAMEQLPAEFSFDMMNSWKIHTNHGKMNMPPVNLYTVNKAAVERRMREKMDADLSAILRGEQIAARVHAATAPRERNKFTGQLAAKMFPELIVYSSDDLPELVDAGLEAFSRERNRVIASIARVRGPHDV